MKEKITIQYIEMDNDYRALAYVDWTRGAKADGAYRPDIPEDVRVTIALNIAPEIKTDTLNMMNKMADYLATVETKSEKEAERLKNFVSNLRQMGAEAHE
jgi:hypothetical protein